MPYSREWSYVFLFFFPGSKKVVRPLWLNLDFLIKIDKWIMLFRSGHLLWPDFVWTGWLSFDRWPSLAIKSKPNTHMTCKSNRNIMCWIEQIWRHRLERERLMKTLLSKRLAENFWRSFKWCVLTALTKNRPRFLGLTWVRHSSLSRPRRFLIFAADFSSSLAVILSNLAVWPSSSGNDVKRAAGQPGKRNYRIHRTRCDQPPLFLFALFISIL